MYKPHKVNCSWTKVKIIRHVPNGTVLASKIHYLALICSVHLWGSIIREDKSKELIQIARHILSNCTNEMCGPNGFLTKMYTFNPHIDS